MSEKPVLNSGKRFLHEVLCRRKEKEYRRTRANLRRGADTTTEVYAFPYVYPQLPQEATTQERLVLMRVAALAAEFGNIPAVGSDAPAKSLGRWAYEVSRQRMLDRQQQVAFNPKKLDVVGERLAYLHTQDFEEAVRAVSRLMSIASNLSNVPAFDYIALYSLFSYWGNGISEKSQRIRMRVLQDYYGSCGSLIE